MSDIENPAVTENGHETIHIERTPDLVITSVNYQRLVNLGNYENEKVGVAAQVPEGTDPALVVEQLRAFVDQQLGDLHEREALAERVSELRSQLRRLEQDVEQMRGKWEKAREFLAAHGIDTSRYSDVPF